MKHITLNGKEYNTIREATNEYNLNYNTVLTRLSNGWSLDEAFGLKEKIKMGGRGNPIILKGKQYRSILQAVKEYGFKYETVIYRLHIGWSLEEAFELIPRKRKTKKDITNYRFDIFNYKDFSKEVTVNDILFKNLKNVCDYYNKKYSTVYARLKRGWGLYKALDLLWDLIDNTIGKIILHGREFESILQAIEIYNLDKELVYIELSNIDGPITDKDLKEVFHIRNNKKLIINGKKYSYIEEAFKKHKVDKRLYLQRIKRGWSVEEAIFGERISGSNYIKIYGKEFKNLKRVAEYYGVNYCNLYMRINRGWKITEAIKGERNIKKEMIKCTYTDNVTKSNCKICQRKFNMKGTCCLDLCGDYDKCKGCKNGTRSEEFEKWRKIYG